MDSALVIQMARIGDVLQTTPLLGSIKQTWPGCRITLLADALLHELVCGCGYVDDAYMVDMQQLMSAVLSTRFAHENYSLMKRQFDRLASLHFDVIYNLNFSEISVLMTTLPKSSQVLGYWLDEHHRTMGMDPLFAFLNVMVRYRPLSPFNLVDYFCMLHETAPLNRSLKFNVSPADSLWSQTKMNSLSIESKDIVVAFQMGTRHEQRRWPIESYVHLAITMLKNPSMRFILLGSTEEQHLSALFSQKVAGIKQQYFSRIHDLTGRTSIGQLAALLCNANLLISCDTGTMHLATAVGCPVLALFFGPAFAYSTGPYGPDNWIIQARMPCSPCIEGYQGCTQQACRDLIKAEDVALLAEHILGFTALPVFPESNIEIIRTCSQGFETMYKRVNRHLFEMIDLQNICYRELCKTVCNPAYLSAWSDIEPHLGSKADTLTVEMRGIMERLEIQAEWLQDAAHRRPYDIWGARFDEAFSFWHPWIDYYHMDLKKRPFIGNSRKEFAHGLHNALKIIQYINNNLS